MGKAIDHLRRALADHEEFSLASIGGIGAVIAAADELPSAAELPSIVSLMISEWDTIDERAPLVDMIVKSVAVAGPYELDDMLDMLLSDESVVPDLAAQLEGPLRRRAAGEDAAAGIALEAWLRLSLGQWTRSLPLLGRLDELAAAAARADTEQLDPTFLQRLVRCLGAAGEHWPEHDADMAAGLQGLLHHTPVDDNIAFELAMLELHAGLQSDDPQRCLQSLTDARRHLDLCARYEDRLDAVIFGSAVGALITFANGAVPTPAEVDQMRALVVEYRLLTLSEYPHWRQPRADSAVQWLHLTDILARLQDLDRSWYQPAALIESMAAAYRAHRTLTLVQPADVVGRTNGSEPAGDSSGLAALVQPRLVAAAARRDDNLELLERWLAAAENSIESQGMVAAVREIRDAVSGGGAAADPKGPSADVSALAGLLALSPERASELADALRANPEVARHLNEMAAAKAEAGAVDVTIYFQTVFDQVRRALAKTSGLSGIRALRAEQLAEALLRYMRWRGSVEAGGSLGSAILKMYTGEAEAPKETVFADDLHQFLVMNLPVVPSKELRNIANGRVDLICDFGSFALVIECKRELHDASMPHLASRYSFQAAEYNWADPGVGFLMVLDLTPGTRRVRLGDAIDVVTLPPVEAGGVPETVLVGKVQANLPPPSHQSTPAAAAARSAAGIVPASVIAP